MSKIGPIADDLTFIRNKRSRCVHVIVPLTRIEEEEGGEPLPHGAVGEAMLKAWSRPVDVVCGRVLHGSSTISMSLPESQYEFVAEFADKDFCVGCIHGLGDQANLAFMHPLPGQEQD